jgi:hypothetical protein
MFELVHILSFSCDYGTDRICSENYELSAAFRAALISASIKVRDAVIDGSRIGLYAKQGSELRSPSRGTTNESRLLVRDHVSLKPA